MHILNSTKAYSATGTCHVYLLVKRVYLEYLNGGQSRDEKYDRSPLDATLRMEALPSGGQRPVRRF